MATSNYFTPKRMKQMTQSQAAIKDRLDSILQNDFNILRKQSSKYLDYSELSIKNSNPLILDYVKGIYDQYNIPDPLPTTEKKYETPTHQKKPKKRYINLYSSQTNKYESPKVQPYHQPQLVVSKIVDASQRKESQFIQTEMTIKRQRQLGDSVSYRASMSYFDASSHDKQEQTEPNLNNSASIKISKDRVLNNVNPNLQKINTFRPNVLRSQKQQDQAMNTSKPLVSFTYDKKHRRSTTLFQESHVNESFRYCVGCQQALLDVNIQIHQKQCQPFQRVFEMTLLQITQHISQKIQKFEKQVRQQVTQLQQNDLSELTNHSNLVLKWSRVIVGDGMMTDSYRNEYTTVMQIGTKWCMITEKINKIDWFLKIRQGIKKKFNV